MRFLLRRTLHAVFLLAGVSVLSFVFLEIAPGGFFDEMKVNPQISPQTVARLRTQYGLDRPMMVRYGLWLESAARGEFGYSFAYNRPVAPLLAERARNTLYLTSLATLLAWSIALPLGLWSAAHQGSWGDRLAGGALSVLLAVPDVLLALVLLFVAVKTGALPVGGMMSIDFPGLSLWSKAADLLRHFILPGAALALGLLPTLVRHVRAATVEALALPFVRAARAHGIGRKRILLRHVLPAAANPLISLLGISLATLMSASLLVEVVMSWPGLGPFFLEAIMARDVYVVIGTVVLSALFLVAGNLLSDVMLFTFDPRIRRP